MTLLLLQIGNASGSVTAIASQPDGKVVIAGPFSAIGSVPRAGIARLEADGTLDKSFDPGAGANGVVHLMALQTDGKVLIAGEFTTVAGQPHRRIARLKGDGSLDPTFNAGSGPDDILHVLWLEEDGKAVVAGRFENFNGVKRHYLVRLNPDGSVDAAFDAGRNLVGLAPTFRGVTDAARHTDGRLIVGGFFKAADRYDLARVTEDGTIDQSFAAIGVSIQAIAIQPDGKILTSGPVNESRRGELTRLNPDGTTDPTFQRGGPAVHGVFLALQPDGKVIFVGSSGPVLRFNPDGTQDTDFGPVEGSSAGGGTSYHGLELRSDGRILLAGDFTAVNGAPRDGLVRLFQNGLVDPGFVPAAGVAVASSIGLNLSTRGEVRPGEDALIGGFIIDGATSKRVLIRGTGPSLMRGDAPVTGALPDPQLELFDSSGTLVGRNDDWRKTQVGGHIGSDQESDIRATTAAPSQDPEAAMIVTLEPGAYTVINRDANSSSGVGLVEVYDLQASSSAWLANMSTRGRVGVGEKVMIGGIILGGNEISKVLLRALGPSLTAAGVAGALPDSTLALHDGNGELIVSVDDWEETQREEIEKTGIAPSHKKEAAVLAALQPGNYTAVLRGANDTTGVALMEAYTLR